MTVAAGCASPGPPRPPSLHLPQLVRDLSAQRVGEHVDVRFTVPTLSTDRQSLAARKHGAGRLTAQVCRSVETSSAPCTPIQTKPVSAGDAVTLQNALSASERAGTFRPLFYRVAILNGDGRSAGQSRPAVALAGPVPPPIADLAAATTARGMQLTWRRESSPARVQILRTTGSGTHTLAVEGDPGGAVDAEAKPGEALSYMVVRVRTVPAAQSGAPSDLPVSGEPASLSVVRTADVFPPAPPSGLVAVGVQLQGAPPEIDLSWEPNAEPDLAGYLIDRADGRGPATAINAAPVTSISFRDMAVEAGHTYTYTVRAVDRSGNRSKPGAPSTETLRP